MKINKVKCCRPFPSRRCSSKLRNLTTKMVDKLKTLDGAINLNTSLLICETCRLHSLKVRAPETMEQSVAEDFQRDEHLSAASILHQQPSSSRQPLKEVPSAASFISTSSQDTIDDTYSRTHNIELFNRGVAGISVSPISTKKMRKTQYPQKSIWKSLKACGITFSVSEQKTILSW